MTRLFRAPATLPDERSMLEAFRRISNAFETVLESAARIVDRRGTGGGRIRPGESARAVAGQSFVLPSPKPYQGRWVSILVESPIVAVTAETGLVNGLVAVSLRQAGAALFFSNGQGWFGVGAGQNDGVIPAGSVTSTELEDVFKGAGSPEGVVTASPGAIYLNTSGGSGTTVFAKESGTGNTGWVGL
jgi:hypothetical protein